MILERRLKADPCLENPMFATESYSKWNLDLKRCISIAGSRWELEIPTVSESVSSLSTFLLLKERLSRCICGCERTADLLLLIDPAALAVLPITMPNRCASLTDVIGYDPLKNWFLALCFLSVHHCLPTAYYSVMILQPPSVKYQEFRQSDCHKMNSWKQDHI